MAQSNSFFGLRKGSTKSLTFQVLNGKQITKDRVFNVKNPQSLAQMQQRALMATTVTAYSTMKAICDHSFEGIEIGTKTMSEFMRNNIKLLAANVPNINVTEYKTGNFAQNPYMISKGTLTAPNTKYENNKFSVITNVDNAGTKTWGNLAESMGIKKDGMLTFVVVNTGQCYWLRIKFNDALWSTTVSASNNSIIPVLKEKDAVEGNSLEFESIIKMPELESGKFVIELTLSEDETVAAIISEKAESIWKRSTAYLQGKFTYMYEAGFATYPINTTLLLNGGKMSTNVITK